LPQSGAGIRGIVAAQRLVSSSWSFFVFIAAGVFQGFVRSPGIGFTIQESLLFSTHHFFILK